MKSDWAYASPKKKEKKQNQTVRIYASAKTKRMGKKGQIIAENLVFIILNLIFLTILITFVILRTGTDASVEEKYAKQIALMIDAAEPNMTIFLNMENAIDKGKKNGINEIISVNENKVTVKVRDTGGYSYHFFNDVAVGAHKNFQNENEYFFFVSKK
jgi:hypothetical protein